MTAHEVGQLFGALAVVAVISRLFLLPYSRRHPGFAKVAVMDVLAGGLVAGLSAVADQPVNAVLPALVCVLIYDAFRLRRRDREAALTVTLEDVPAPGLPALGVAMSLVAFVAASVGVHALPGAMQPGAGTLAEALETAQPPLPAPVAEVTRAVEVTAVDDSLVYRYEVLDHSAAELMRAMSPEELKFAISQGIAQAGADVCEPIAAVNRRYAVRYDYVDDTAAPVNSYAYSRGECA
jgi:hypothetical protein